MLSIETRARRVLMRGLGFLCFGLVTASPLGIIFTAWVNLVLASVGLRYGGVRITT